MSAGLVSAVRLPQTSYRILGWPEFDIIHGHGMSSIFLSSISRGWCSFSSLSAGLAAWGLFFVPFFILRLESTYHQTSPQTARSSSGTQKPVESFIFLVQNPFQPQAESWRHQPLTLTRDNLFFRIGNQHRHLTTPST